MADLMERYIASAETARTDAKPIHTPAECGRNSTHNKTATGSPAAAILIAVWGK
jgi:hypothetical protein